jgi:hypothetical protein
LEGKPHNVYKALIGEVMTDLVDRRIAIREEETINYGDIQMLKYRRGPALNVGKKYFRSCECHFVTPEVFCRVLSDSDRFFFIGTYFFQNIIHILFYIVFGYRWLYSSFFGQLVSVFFGHL